MSARFAVGPARWDVDADRAAMRHVRDTVFGHEQHVSREDEYDGLDPSCGHVLARDAAGAPIGTGRLTRERVIGRVAVLEPWRGRGVGSALLRALIARAQVLGYADVSLHAQVEAVGFYLRHGFETHGEEFVEAGIRHRHMRRSPV
jgi:predicted GNAT family N-acyltransferase